MNSPTQDDATPRARETILEERIPLVEETLTIGKRTVATGEVRVRSVVEEVAETLRADLARETVTVERVAVDRPVDAAPTIRTEGDVTVVPVLEERLVVTRQLVLVEELHIRRVRTLEPTSIDAMRKVMRAVVERTELSDITATVDSGN